MVGELKLKGGREGDEAILFSFPDDESRWVLGSDPEKASFFLDDPSIASQHLLFSLVDGAILVQNFDESGNALLNGEPIPAPEVLKNGDELKVGDLVFEYTSGNKEEESLEQQRESIFGEAPADTIQAPEIHFDLLEGGRFVLKVVGGPNNGAEFPLVQGESYTLGTDPKAADVVFQDVSVSRQHARLSLNDDGTLLLTDLGSRNGTYVEEAKIEGESTLPPNKVVTLGTSSFIIVDNEGERSTIISPLLPSIVKVLQKQGDKEAAAKAAASSQESTPPTFSILGAFILIAVISALLAIVGLGVRSLLKTEDIEKTETVDIQKQLETILASYPDIRFSYNQGTGRLLLIGHVLTNVERSELMIALQNLPSIRSIDDNIIVDEFVWKEANQVLGQTSEWRGISMFSPSPGIFAVTGVVQKRRQLDSLIEYLNQNFNFPEHLDFRVVVEEDLLNQVHSILRNRGFAQLKASFSEGQLRISGSVPKDQEESYQEALVLLSKLPGVRTVQNTVIEQRVEGVINITSRYKVSGLLGQEGGKTSVVINGRILTKGDSIDGMTITDIRSDGIFLEKEGEKFKIDYNR